MAPVRYGNGKSEGRMREVLEMVVGARVRLSALRAAGPHDLAHCFEAESIVLCAEIFFRAFLERKESRGWFVREDYPAAANADWLKWTSSRTGKGRRSSPLRISPSRDIPSSREGVGMGAASRSRA